MLIYLFQKSLERDTLVCISSCLWNELWTFENVVSRFLHQYKHQTDHLPSLVELMNLTQKPDESVVSFIDRWKSLASRATFIRCCGILLFEARKPLVLCAIEEEYALTVGGYPAIRLVWHPAFPIVSCPCLLIVCMPFIAQNALVTLPSLRSPCWLDYYPWGGYFLLFNGNPIWPIGLLSWLWELAGWPLLLTD